MREAWSQFEQAWRDTLVHRAEAAAFQPLCRLYGLEYPEVEVPEKSWADVLKLNAYGTRGNFDTVFKSTESAFSHYNVKIQGYVNGSAPHILVSNGTWPSGLINRYIRKGDKLYFTKSQISPSELEVVASATFYWDAPSQEIGTHEYTFEVLPFVVHERNPGRVITSDPNLEDFFTHGEVCLFEVILFLSNNTLVPRTWLQAPSSYSTEASVYTEEGVPYGGAILEGETAIGNPSGYGPHPLYAYDAIIFPVTSKVMASTLAASVEYRAMLNPPV